MDIRIIAATHRDPRQMVLSGQFREDLWFRLNVFPIVIPNLRERKEDILIISELRRLPVNLFILRGREIYMEGCAGSDRRQVCCHTRSRV